MNFDSIHLDEMIKKQVDDCFRTGRIPHAVITEGADEKSRREFSLFLAQALMCSGEEKPCGKCPGCIRMKAGFHSDVEIFEGSGKSGAVNIEDVRKIKNDAYIVPNEADYKVFIIKNAHKMNEYAQNALLKCLEEPPSYVVIILECEDKAKMLETVRSRSALFRLGETEEQILSEKKREKAVILASKIAKAINEPGEAPLMSLLGEMEKDKDYLKLCIRELTVILRDAVVFKRTPEERLLISEEKETAKEISGSFREKQFVDMIETLSELDEWADNNANNSLLLSKMCYQLRRDAGR